MYFIPSYFQESKKQEPQKKALSDEERLLINIAVKAGYALEENALNTFIQEGGYVLDPRIMTKDVKIRAFQRVMSLADFVKVNAFFKGLQSVLIEKRNDKKSPFDEADSVIAAALAAEYEYGHFIGEEYREDFKRKLEQLKRIQCRRQLQGFYPQRELN